MIKEPSHFGTAIGKIGSVIGKGLIAGLAGTAAITLSQLIEMKINKRPPSFAPGDAASRALGIEASTRENRKKFSNEVHWTYGTLWGIPRGLLSLPGWKGLTATSLHFGAIFYTAITIEPDFEVAPPFTEWSKKDITLHAFHHLVYAVAAGLVYDAINKKDKKDDRSFDRP